MKKTIFEKQGGKPFVCEGADARELVDGKKAFYVATDPNDKKPKKDNDK